MKYRIRETGGKFYVELRITHIHQDAYGELLDWYAWKEITGPFVTLHSAKKNIKGLENVTYHKV